MKLLAFILVALVALPAAAVDLPTALQAALAADPALASARANRDAAQENIAIARARLLPQISLQGTFQQLSQTTTQGTKSTDFSGPTQSTQLSLRQALYRPRDTTGLEIGKLQAAYGEAKLQAAQSDLWGRTTDAWIEGLVAQAQRDLYSRTLASVAVAAEQEKRRFNAGEGTRDVMAESSAQLALAQAQLTEATFNLKARVQAFNLLTRLGVVGFDGLRLPQLVGFGQLPGTDEAFLAHVLEANPELTAASATEGIEEKRVAQAMADHKPTLDFVGSLVSGQNDTANTTLGTEYKKSTYGFQLILPLYAGGGVNAAQRQAVAVHAASVADREALIQRLTIQIGASWQSLAGLHERAGAAIQLLQATLEQRRGIELGIKTGMKTWVDLGAADLQLARRESDLVSMIGMMAKTQTRLLTMLPATDLVWERWTTLVSRQAMP